LFVLVVLIAGRMFFATALDRLASVERGLSMRGITSCWSTIPGFRCGSPVRSRRVEHARLRRGTMEKNDQAENRFKLWSEAIEIGVSAGMLGLGPGPHLVNKQWKRPPPDKFEAHFVVLDLRKAASSRRATSGWLRRRSWSPAGGAWSR
jgi:hypothetical protein